MAGGQPSEAQTLRAVERLVTDSLPPGWSLRSTRQPRRRSGTPDALWSIQGPDGSVAIFAVEAKRLLLGRQVGDVLAQLAASEARPLLVAPYLSPTVRSSLADRGVSFADTTGNVRLVADRPGLFVERQGASKDPWPPDDTLHSLNLRLNPRRGQLHPSAELAMSSDSASSSAASSRIRLALSNQAR